MRSMLEGAPRPTSVHDSEDYPLEVVEHFIRRNAHSQKSRILEISVPSRIPRRPVTSFMRFPINLNRQACRKTGEVQHERPLRALFPKPVAAGPLLQRPPEETLGWTHLLP